MAEFSDIKEMCFVWGLALKCLSASLVNGFDPATTVVVDVYNVGQRLHICGSNKPTRGFVNKQNTDEPSYTSLTGNNTVNPIPNNPIQIYSLIFCFNRIHILGLKRLEWIGVYVCV